MYTFNLFCFGHNLPEEIIEKLNERGLTFSIKINNREWTLQDHYHGGLQTSPYTFGIEIANDDSNPKYITQVRSAQEKDYEEDYKIFVDKCVEDLEMCLDEDTEDEVQLLKEFKEFLTNNEPCFYSVQISS